MVSARKRCPDCGTLKELSCFGKHKQANDGLKVHCRDCNNARARTWTAANKERSLAQSRKWAAENPERARAIKQKHYQANKERYAAIKAAQYRADPERNKERKRVWAKKNRVHCNAKSAAWQKKNKAYGYGYHAMRRSARMNATPSWLTGIQRAQIQEFYEVAQARTMQTGIVHHVDHVHPLKGRNFRGLHVPWNLQVLTATENISKGCRLLDANGGENR